MKRKNLNTYIKCFLILAFMLNICGAGNYLSAQNGSGSNNENNDNEQTRVKYKVKKKIFRYNNVISVYPLQAISNYMSLGYEFKTSEKTAFKTMAGFAQQEGNSVLFNTSDITLKKYSAFKIEMQLKYFIGAKANVFNGIYFAPFGLYKSCNFNYDITEYLRDPISGYYYTKVTNKKDNAGAFHVGFLLGFQQRLGDNFTLDLYAGEGLMSASGDYKNGSRVFDVYTNAIRLKLGLNLGFGF